jgi:hypothetical protein
VQRLTQTGLQRGTKPVHIDEENQGDSRHNENSGTNCNPFDGSFHDSFTSYLFSLCR